MEKFISGDLENGWQPPAPDQGFESKLFQLVSIMHDVCMQLKGSLVDPLWIKAELFKMVQSVKDWTSYTKKDGVEYNLFGFQAPA